MIEVPTADGIDVEALYGLLGRRLEAIVARRVSAPAEVIEDACQVAWIRLVRHRRAVLPDAAPSWLVTTAVREALLALRRQRRERRAGEGREAPEACGGAAPGPDELAEARLRIARIRELPERQQRLVWLHGLGYRYAEIGRQTGDSPRTVERQLKRARSRLRTLAA
jgi:RNA polymerase sigma factor (sigma-70 family)